MFDTAPATVVTFDDIPATAETLLAIPATVCMAFEASVPSSISASVAISPEIPARVLPSATVKLASGLPVDELNPSSLPSRELLAGSVKSAPEMVSCSGTNKALSSL